METSESQGSLQSILRIWIKGSYGYFRKDIVSRAVKKSNKVASDIVQVNLWLGVTIRSIAAE